MPSPPRPFDEPIYVTRPLLPPLDDYVRRLGSVWESKWLTNVGEQHRRLERELPSSFARRIFRSSPTGRSRC